MFWTPTVRDGIDVTGPDAATYLQSQVSQDLRSMTDGSSAWTFLLEPTGKVDALARVRRITAEHFEFDIDAGFGEVLMARLMRFRIRVKVDMIPVRRSLVAVRGGHQGAPPDALVAWGDGFDIDVTNSAVDVASLLGAEVGHGDEADLQHARVARCWPAMGAEIEPGATLPDETGLVDVAVGFGKGCYPGQELVERMHSRGASAPFHLITLPVSQGAAVGDDAVIDGVVAGRLTSVSRGLAIARVGRNVRAEGAAAIS